MEKQRIENTIRSKVKYTNSITKKIGPTQRNTETTDYDKHQKKHEKKK